MVMNINTLHRPGVGFTNIWVSSYVRQNTYALRKNFKWYSQKELMQFLKICCITAINCTGVNRVCSCTLFCHILSQSTWRLLLKQHARSCMLLCHTQLFGSACFCTYYNSDACIKLHNTFMNFSLREYRLSNICFVSLTFTSFCA